MKYVILTDGTQIDNCTDSTTSQNIVVLRDTYALAGAVRDLFTDDNTSVIEVYEEDGTTSVIGSNLVLVSGCTISETTDGYTCVITLRGKTNEEKMQEEIAELQEIVLEE